MSCVSSGENTATFFPDDWCLAAMHHGRSHQADPGMAVLIVVPAKKRLAESASILDAAEAIWKLRAVLHSSKLAFRIRVVVGGVRAAVTLGDTKIGHQESHRLG